MAPILLVALTVVAAAAGSGSRGMANNVTYLDATGEDPAAPDITTVRVSNDDGGTLTFRIAMPTRPELRDDLRLSISIDADSNAETGLSGLGVDYRLLYDFQLHGDRLLWLLTCERSVCTSGAKLPFSYESGPVITIDRSELGATRSFRFWINTMDGIVFDPVTRTFDDTKAHGDVAPDWTIGRWSYDVRIGPSKLLVQRFSTSPARPIAGKTFTVRLAVERDDTGARVTTGRVRCAATVGGVPVRLERRGFRRGAAFCTWGVPRGVTAKTMRGSITVAFAGKTARKSFVKAVS